MRAQIIAENDIESKIFVARYGGGKGVVIFTEQYRPGMDTVRNFARYPTFDAAVRAAVREARRWGYYIYPWARQLA